ncbi:Serine/threonine-protein kinase CLA4 [Pseudozyma hubeiensis]|nr:Serine/threonine-protein kinase CLA4 [Pseudozyma hubeiensis]
MVNTSRSRTALSPIPQNQSAGDAPAPVGRKGAPSATSRTTADITRRSALRAKLAHASSTLLRSPSLVNHASCIIELPLVNASPFAPMQMAQVRAGLKRKMGARDQLGRASQTTTHTRPPSEYADASTSHAQRRSASASTRSRSGKQLNIVTSPHIPRDKPVSSASELSDWSSVLSVSPTASRPPTSRSEDPVAPMISRPGIQTRRSSRNSLYKTLDGMTLEERGLGRSSRSQSRTTSRQNSGFNAIKVDDNAAGPPASYHLVRTKATDSVRATPDSDPSSDASINMDDEEAEQTRLVSSAPTWQLHRLRKDELIQLCYSAGAFLNAPTHDELELVTKQDLVNQIITCRSRLDRSRSDERHAPAPSHRQSRSRRHSSLGYSEHSDEVADPHQDASGALRATSSPRRSSYRLVGASLLAASSSSAEDCEGDLTDASNEAGGEETEAEPHDSPSGRRQGGRLSHTRSKALAEGIALHRMDSATFDDFEPSKANQTPRRQLRNKTALRGALVHRQRLANGSGATSASTSSSMFGGRSSRASNTSNPPFGHRQQLGVFVASSPVRTRSRTARLTLGLPSRRKTATRGAGAHDVAAPAQDPMATPKIGHRRPQRGKKSVKFNAGLPGQQLEHDQDEWMEDLSSDSDAVAAALQSESMALNRDDSEPVLTRSGTTRTIPRRTLRARQSTADSDASFTSHQPRSRSASIEAPPLSDPGDASLNGPDDDDDMLTSDKEDDDDGATPTKFRKLRNGKLRLVVGASEDASDLRSGRAEQFDDVNMESVDETVDRDGIQQTESPEAEATPSEGSDDVMLQPTFATLSRLRKSELEQLCLNREIDMDEEDKKASLIKKLLDWRQLSQLGADKDARFDDEEDGDETRSDRSTGTAVAEDDQGKSGQRTPTRRRNTRATSNAYPSATDSDQPLLLRARGKVVSSEKLPTPPLTSNNEEANPPQPGDGVDELNGLDLESLNLTDKEIAPSKLEKLEKIGSGGFKDVYVGKYRISKTRVNKVAIADIRDQLTEMDIKELSLLRDLRHENIVRFIGVSIPEDPRHVPCMIVSELCSNGDLFDYIRNTQAPSDTEVFRILLETARGLEYLHTRTPAIIHRDCKSTNVLITRRRTAKINDFGLARVKNTSRSMMRSLVGTVNWQAVELWVPKPHYNEKVDVWSAAMTFWEALQWHQAEKKYPFQGMNEHQIYQDVGQKRQRPYTGFIRRQFGGEIVDLLDRMWDQTPKNRPSMTEVCSELESLIQMKKEAAAAAAGSATRK